jgi:uncharacterized membrane protein YadS
LTHAAPVLPWFAVVFALLVIVASTGWLNAAETVFLAAVVSLALLRH